DEQVVPDVAPQHLAGIAYPRRQAGRVVDAYVPAAPAQRRQVAGLAVAMQLLDLARPLGRWPLAAIEQGHPVAAGQRITHLERPGESGAAQDQDVQRAAGAVVRVSDRHWA